MWFIPLFSESFIWLSAINEIALLLLKCQIRNEQTKQHLSIFSFFTRSFWSSLSMRRRVNKMEREWNLHQPAYIGSPGISHLFRSGDFSSVSNELPLWRRPRFEAFWGLCQDPFLFPASAAVLACSRLFSRFAMFCSMSISICCSSSIISDAAYELQLPSGGLYRISKQTTVCAY